VTPARARRAPALLGALALTLGLAAPTGAGADEALWERLRGGGQVVLIRHASTEPGLGDPPGFRLDDCATQRNLSDAGREEARRIGEAFRARGVPVGRVLSSPWCRCLETAHLAFGRAEPWEALRSLYDEPDRERERTEVVRALIAAGVGPDNLVLVTHNFNIRALTGIGPASGELVVVTPEPAALTVAGRLPPSALR